MNTVRIAIVGSLAVFVAAIVAIVGLALVDAGDDAAKYSVHINFTREYTEADLTEAADILRTFDPDVDMMVLESFPPQGSAVIESDDPDVCTAVEAAFEGKAYTGDVSCVPYVPVTDGNGDEPVSTTAD
jgi:hypothetical protein